MLSQKILAFRWLLLWQRYFYESILYGLHDYFQIIAHWKLFNLAKLQQTTQSSLSKIICKQILIRDEN